MAKVAHNVAVRQALNYVYLMLQGHSKLLILLVCCADDHLLNGHDATRALVKRLEHLSQGPPANEITSHPCEFGTFQCAFRTGRLLEEAECHRGIQVQGGQHPCDTILSTSARQSAVCRQLKGILSQRFLIQESLQVIGSAALLLHRHFGGLDDSGLLRDRVLCCLGCGFLCLCDEGLQLALLNDSCWNLHSKLLDSSFQLAN
mmetsp:Transcript_10073/g.22640  ORF Transcript_10073/g.22640 Transcript_10073/m.22640 type:complete len:203 (-) Transcript_10073:304-912(-)